MPSQKTIIKQPPYKKLFMDAAAKAIEQSPELTDAESNHLKSESAAMGTAAATIWAETKAHLIENNLVTKTRLHLADRYVRARVEYTRIHPRALAEGPVKKGPNGGEYFNLTWAACEKLNDRILKFEDSLMISPRAAGASLGASATTKNTPADKWLGKK